MSEIISKIDSKRFLLPEQLKRVQFVCILFGQISVHLINFSEIKNDSFLQNDVGIAKVSLIIVLLTIATFGEMFYVPQKIKEQFAEQFPGFTL